MTQVPSPLATPNTGMPLINAADRSQLGGLPMIYPNLAALNTAAATEATRVAATEPQWEIGQPIGVASETAIGVWRSWDRSAGHARTAILPSGLRVTLANTTATVFATSGAPSGGSNGDVAIDVAAGTYYVRGSSTWGAAQRLTPAGSSVPSQVAFSQSVPLTGPSFMAQTNVTGPLNFTPNLSGAVPSAYCLITLVANGNNVPTFTGMLKISGSGNWSNVAGDVNEVSVWMMSNNRVYYSIDQAYPVENVLGAQATVPGAPTNLGANGTTASTISLSWTAPAINGGAAITDYLVQYSGNGGATWTSFIRPASSSTNATVTGLTASTPYGFRVAAVNSAGAGAFSEVLTQATSAATAPSITQQPASQTVAPGNSVTFTVAASGSGTLTYQWERNTGSSWAAISGATAPTLTFAAQSGENGYLYRCVVTGNGSATSNSATLTVTGGTLAGWQNLTHSGVLTETGDSTNGWVWTLTSAITDWGFAYANQGGALTGDFAVEMVVKAHTSTTRQMLMLSPTASNFFHGNSNPGAMVVSNPGGTGWTASFSTGTWGLKSNLPAPAAGHIVRFRRVGAGLSLELSTDNRATWTNMALGGYESMTNGQTPTLYPAVAMQGVVGDQVGPVRVA